MKELGLDDFKDADEYKVSGAYRVRRGGSWSDSPRLARVAARNWATPDIRNNALGLRLARTSP